MKITQTSKPLVTYLDHVKRFQGFMTESRQQEIYTKELPIDADSHAVVELQVRSVLNGLDSIVTYKQLIINEEGKKQEVILLQYPFKKDLTTTQLMIEAAAKQMHLTSEYIQQIREVLPALMLQDMVSNNVYDLTADDWTTEVF